MLGGSFDPIHLGHLDVIEQALDLFGAVVVVTMHNPAGLFVSFFREALAKHGIRVSGRTRTANWLDQQAKPRDLNQLVELGFMESPPLREIAREVQKHAVHERRVTLVEAHQGQGVDNGRCR